MTPTGKEEFFTLRELIRRSEYRRFRAKHKSGRWADFYGFEPDGESVIGWWDNGDAVAFFDPDTRNWSNPTTYY